MNTPRVRRAPRRGFALLAAVALLALTSLVTLELSVSARPRRLAAANAIEHVAAKAAARAGLEEGRARLLRSVIVAGQAGQTPIDPWATVAAMPVAPAALGELRYSVVMRDVGESLHLNHATEEQMRRLLVALLVDATRADRAAQAILDWRDGDDLHRGRGAERVEYLRAERPVLPSNAPFRSVAELRHVAGIDDALYARLHPHLTVVGSGRVNLNAAGREVLVTLPGMSDESVALVMRKRRRGQRITNLSAIAQELSAPGRRRLVEAMPALIAAVVLETRELHVTSTASSHDGIERARAEALMVKENGVRLLWRRTSP